MLPSPAMASDPAAMKTEVGGGGGGAGDAVDLIFKGLKKARRDRGCTAKDRISKMPPCAAGKRSSIYRGVTRHRWTGRYEAHLWDKSTWNQNQNKKGKQVYLGAYDDEEAAARAYDLAALKYWGPGTIINFPVSDYSRDLEEMQMMSREDYLASLRRKSSGFSRGLSKYRGIPRSTQNRWDSSFGQVLGNEYFSNLNCGTSEGAATESELLAGFCLERKIDLTGCIKWWGTTHKTHRSESHTKSSEGSHKVIEDISTELKSSEWSVQHTEPYQFPSLGLPHSKKIVPSARSACSIVSQSAALKCLQDKLTKVQEGNNKEKLAEDGAGKPEVPTTSGEFCLTRTSYPLGSLISSSLLTSCNAIDHPIPDPLFWTGLVPPTGLSSSTAVSIGRKSTEDIYAPQ